MDQTDSSTKVPNSPQLYYTLLPGMNNQVKQRLLLFIATVLITTCLVVQNIISILYGYTSHIAFILFMARSISFALPVKGYPFMMSQHDVIAMVIWSSQLK